MERTNKKKNVLHVLQLQYGIFKIFQLFIEITSPAHFSLIAT